MTNPSQKESCCPWEKYDNGNCPIHGSQDTQAGRCGCGHLLSHIDGVCMKEGCDCGYAPSSGKKGWDTDITDADLVKMGVLPNKSWGAPSSGWEGSVELMLLDAIMPEHMRGDVKWMDTACSFIRRKMDERVASEIAKTKAAIRERIEQQYQYVSDGNRLVHALSGGSLISRADALRAVDEAV